MMKKSKDEEEQRGIFVRAVRSFFKITQTKKNVENAYNEQKIDFENIMDVLFKRFSDDKGDAYVNGDENVNGTQIKVHKVQQTKIKWDIPKLKKVIGEENFKDVVSKKYYIENFPLLIKLAKEYKIPWKEFKKCISYEENIVDSAVDKLVDLGKADEEEVKKCATVELKKPYYLLTEK